MSFEAVVVGSGPNGLAGAIELARAGGAVTVLEGAPTAGGGCRSLELTAPGFLHDVCATVHPMGASSPFFRSLDLERFGFAWAHPELPLAHPLDDGTAVVLARGVAETADGLGEDAGAYRRLLEPLAEGWLELADDVLSPVGVPRRPLRFARFGLLALRSAEGLVAGRFRGRRARALLAGLAAHGMLPLERPPSAAFALSLAAAGHAVGWPLARGGSQALADALVAALRAAGGAVRTGAPVTSDGELPAAQVVLWDVAPRNLVRIAGRRLPAGYRRRLLRFRHGPGVFKMDWALREPIPWTASACARAGTVHLGGTWEEIAASERSVWRGRVPTRPYAIVVQPSRFDGSRAPPGRHTAWAYCHVPAGCRADLCGAIEAQVERFAPGFRDCVLERSAWGPEQMEAHNPNDVGGDISGGVQDLAQTLVRPASLLRPYRIPVPGWYLCSASTPPGGGVHGMCGYHAARAALAGEGLRGGARRGGGGTG
ncbi:MAG: NAD(P)/FAD-dependent oxidoreductase [Deferrisomatales bacterium]